MSLSRDRPNPWLCLCGVYVSINQGVKGEADVKVSVVLATPSLLSQVQVRITFYTIAPQKRGAQNGLQYSVSQSQVTE